MQDVLGAFQAHGALAKIRSLAMMFSRPVIAADFRTDDATERS